MTEVLLTASGYGSYDAYKLRSDLDDRPAVDEREECGTCEGLDGAHDRACPERKAFGDWVDAEIDRTKESEP